MKKSSQRLDFFCSAVRSRVQQSPSAVGVRKPSKTPFYHKPFACVDIDTDIDIGLNTNTNTNTNTDIDLYFDTDTDT